MDRSDEFNWRQTRYAVCITGPFQLAIEASFVMPGGVIAVDSMILENEDSLRSGVIHHDYKCPAMPANISCGFERDSCSWSLDSSQVPWQRLIGASGGGSPFGIHGSSDGSVSSTIGSTLAPAAA